MENFDSQKIKIADYLDNKMSPAEEEAFMQEIDKDDGLLALFEDELMMEALFYQNDKESTINEPIPNIAFLPAEDHLKIVAAALSQAKQPQAGIIVLPIKNWVTVAAAVLVLIIGSTATILTLQKATSGNIATNTKGTIKRRNDSILQIDSTPKSLGPETVQTSVAENVYRQYFAPYKSTDDDPIETSLFYSYYSKHQYRQVLNADEADLQTMGADSDGKQKLMEYLHLYKGLSLLAIERPADAVTQFDSLLQTATKTSPQYYNSQWYKTLALVKMKKLAQAQALAAFIAQSNSPYNKKAKAVVQALP